MCRGRDDNLNIIELAMCVFIACVRSATPKWLMSPSPKSQVMFASAFSWIGDFFRIFGIHIFKVTASLLNWLICKMLLLLRVLMTINQNICVVHNVCAWKVINVFAVVERNQHFTFPSIWFRTCCYTRDVNKNNVTSFIRKKSSQCSIQLPSDEKVGSRWHLGLSQNTVTAYLCTW